MDELSIVFSDHARRQLEERKLNVRIVRLTVLYPNKLILHDNKYFAYRKFGKLYFKVVFGKVAENIIIVITQHFVKKLP